MKRTWFRVHSSTGVITGLLLFVICWSGTFAVFSKELDWLASPELRVEPLAQFSTWGEIQAAAQAAVPGATVNSIFAPLNERAAAQLFLTAEDGQALEVWVNPYTAEVTAMSTSRYTIQRFFRSFHMSFFIPTAGLYLVTLFGITLLLSLGAGLMFYKRWWSRFLRFKSGNGRIFWSELHKTSGLWSIWFVLLIGVTSVWYLFEISRLDFGDGKVRYAGSGEYAVMQIPEPAGSERLPTLSLNDIVESLASDWPEFEISAIHHDWPVEGSVSFEGDSRFPLVRERANQAHVDPVTGKLLLQHAWHELPVYWLWSDMADPLHFGDFGGIWSKAVWFVFGVILSGLILSGTYLHSKRLIQEARGRRRHRWPGTLAAILVSVFVLIAAVPFGLFEAREYYGESINGVKQLPSLATGVKWILMIWLSLTLGIIFLWVRAFWSALHTKRAV